MVGYLPHCTFNLNPRAASIDTPLHAYRAARACRPHASRTPSSRSPPRRTPSELTSEIFGGAIGWLPWKRPGFELGLWLEQVLPGQSRCQAAWCWKATACSPGAIPPRTATKPRSRIINQADRVVRAKTEGKAVFGGAASSRCAAGERRAIAARADAEDPRPDLGRRATRSGHFDDSAGRAGVRQFEASCEPLAALGTSCPDHFLRTKIRPLVIDFDPAKPDVEARGRQPPTAHRGLSRRLSRPTTIAASTTIRLPCATPTRWSIWCRASACSPSPRTRPRRASPASSMSTPST